MIGIITILTTLLVGAVKLARQSAMRAQCASNLRQVGALIHAYAAVNDGEIPATYGPDVHGVRPMGWCNIAVSDHGNGSGGMLLLVNHPIGMGRQGYAPDANLFICLGDPGTEPREPNDFFAVRGDPGTFTRSRGRMSYVYCYVPAGGDSYRWWNYDPNTVGTGKGERSGMPHWDRGALAGFERHNVNQRHATSTVVMFEGSVLHISGWPWTEPHGRGGSVLYLDGHVITGVSKELPDEPSTRQTYQEDMTDFTILDHEAGKN